MIKRLIKWWNSEEANRKIEWSNLRPGSNPSPTHPKPPPPPNPPPAFKMFQGNPRNIKEGDKVVFYYKNDPLTYFVGTIITHKDSKLYPGFLIKSESFNKDPFEMRIVALSSDKIAYRKLAREEYFYYMMSGRLLKI